MEATESPPRFIEHTSLKICFLLIATLSAIAQSSERPTPDTEVEDPDRTVIHAKTRSSLNAKKMAVGDSLMLEVLEDVYTAQAAAPEAKGGQLTQAAKPGGTVLIPRNARLIGQVVSVKPAAGTDAVVTASIRVTRAEWEGGYAKLTAVITRVFPQAGFTGRQYTPSKRSGRVFAESGPPIGKPPPAGPYNPRQQPTRATTGPIIDSPPAPTLPPERLWVSDELRGTVDFAPPYKLSSGTVLYLQHYADLDAALDAREREEAQAVATLEARKREKAQAAAALEAMLADPETQLRQGIIFHKDRKYSEAAECYRKAAEAGVAMAQNNLAVLYAEGQGVAQDYVAAHMWFTIAAVAKPDKNKTNLQLLQSHMTPEQIAESQRRAEEWLKQHPAVH